MLETVLTDTELPLESVHWEPWTPTQSSESLVLVMAVSDSMVYACCCFIRLSLTFIRWKTRAFTCVHYELCFCCHSVSRKAPKYLCLLREIRTLTKLALFCLFRLLTVNTTEIAAYTSLHKKLSLSFREPKLPQDLLHLNMYKTVQSSLTGCK